MSYRVCETCGAKVPQWSHRCPECGAARTGFRVRLLLAALALLAGCDTVTEYKCDAQQIEAARAQFEYCKTGISFALDSKRIDQCWAEATRAHCTIVREYQRTGAEQ